MTICDNSKICARLVGKQPPNVQKNTYLDAGRNCLQRLHVKETIFCENTWEVGTYRIPRYAVTAITMAGRNMALANATLSHLKQAVLVPGFCIQRSAAMTLAAILLTHIRETRGLNLGRDTHYTDWGSSWFSSRKVSGQYLQVSCNSLLSQPFEFVIHCHPHIRHYIVRVTAASLNKLQAGLTPHKRCPWENIRGGR